MDPKDGKQEPLDPDKAMRMMELELMHQRAVRQNAGSPYSGLRVASFIFLFLVILGTLAAFYYAFFYGGLDEARARKSQQANPSATAAP